MAAHPIFETGTMLDDRGTLEHFTKIAGAYGSVRTTDVEPVL